jgi:ribonucrease Y
VTTAIVAVLSLAAGALVAALVAFVRARASHESLRAKSEQAVKETDAERERVLRAAEIDAKEKLLRLQQEHEQEVKKQRDELTASERRLRQRETNLERRNDTIEQRERELKRRESQNKEAEQQAQGVLRDAQNRLQESVRELERVANLSREQAREELIKALEEEARKEAAGRIKRIEEEAKREADERGKRILAGAIQRFASGFVAEKTVSVVELPADEMKGRIIGREGRNIRAIEAATGVDIIIDDTPEVVVVSAFNPIRREIARLALERLVVDGRIHPARIEEVVEQVKQELEESMQRFGEQATFDLGLQGMHVELVKLVGKLKYRNVNGQNLWNHSVETAVIAGLIAAELGFDQNLAKRAGLLHDVGKAVDHEAPGPHWSISAEQARRYGEKMDVVQAIRHYHDDDPPSVLGVILQVADALSKARPGARRDLLETYIKRLSELERISTSFKGVEHAYAIQAGREVRVMVDYQHVSDEDALMLSSDIARRIQDTLTYPGEVKVTVIREARATEVAK